MNSYTPYRFSQRALAAMLHNREVVCLPPDAYTLKEANFILELEQTSSRMKFTIVEITDSRTKEFKEIFTFEFDQEFANMMALNYHLGKAHLLKFPAAIVARILRDVEQGIMPNIAKLCPHLSTFKNFINEKLPAAKV